MAAEFDPHGVLIARRLPDIDGADLAAELQRRQPKLVCVVMPGTSDGADHEQDSMKDLVSDEANDSLSDSLNDSASDSGNDSTHHVDVDDALVAVRVLTALRTPSTASDVEAPEAHSLSRWAGPVVRVIAAQRDPRTLREWGRCIGVSTGALRNWCRTARLSARRSLLFARVLRAIIRQHQTQTTPEGLLNIRDRRTMVRVIAVSGGRANRLPQTVDEFLAAQRLVESAAAVAQIRAALARIESPLPGGLSSRVSAIA